MWGAANPSRHKKQNASPPPRLRRSSAAAAAGDSVPFTAYTVDGRAGRDCSLLFMYVRITFIITMSTDTDRAAAEKAEADKKAARMSRLLPPSPPPRGRLEGIHRLSLSCFFLL